MVTTAPPAVNIPVKRLADILKSHAGDERWAEMMTRDGRNRAMLIAAPEGTPPDPHLHPDFNEFWILLGGQTYYQIGQYEAFTAGFGDIVIAPCGFRHDIQAVGEGLAMRLVVGPPWSNHDIKGIPPSRLLPLPDEPPPNLVLTRFESMLERHGTDTAWGEEVLLDQRNRINFIHSLPGDSNNPHWHPNFDEWWVVLKGELEWEVGVKEPFRAGRGDVVFVPAGYRHEIRTVGDESAVRLAVTDPEAVHIYDGEQPAPFE